MEHSKLGLIWFMNNTEISYDLHLIIIQIRPGFHIYILERSFCLLLYTITMIQHYSRCVIRQLLWLRFINTTCVVLTRFLTCHLSKKLCANCLISDAREHITRESLDNGPRHLPLRPRSTGWYICIQLSRGTCIPQNVTHVFMYLCYFMSMYCATLCPCIVQLYVHILCNLLSTPKGAKVYPASRRRSNKRVGLKGQLAPHCVPWLKYIMAYKRLFTSLGSKTLNTFSLGLGNHKFKTQL